MALGTILTQYILPVAVLISAAATTATATFAWRLYTAVEIHDRALFGEDRVDGHDGIVEAVNENSDRSERNERVLHAHDMLPNPGDLTDDSDE